MLVMARFIRNFPTFGMIRTLKLGRFHGRLVMLVRPVVGIVVGILR